MKLTGVLPDETQEPSVQMNTEEANLLLELASHPGWAIYMQQCEQHRQLYATIMLGVPYGPYAEQKFRHYQTLAQNVSRIPRAIMEEAYEIVEGKNTTSGHWFTSENTDE